MSLTAADLIAATGCSPLLAPRLAPALDAAMSKFNITTLVRQAHFLAQTAFESMLYTRREEALNYSAQRMAAVFPNYFFLPPEDPKGRGDANMYVGKPEALANVVYGGRLGNGPVGSGDGFRFRGRGFIQLTGRKNYSDLATAIGVSVVSTPEWLLTDEGASTSAAWFWNMRNCNAAADTGSIQAVTRKINGGDNGLPQRTVLTMRALDALGVPASPT